MNESSLNEPVMESALAESRTAPRLGIVHVMLWTLCTAVYFALFRWMNDVRLGEMGEADTFQSIIQLLQCVISGTGITGVIVLVMMRLQFGAPLLRQPGHWIVFWTTLTAIAMLAIFLAVMTYSKYFYDESEYFDWVGNGWLFVVAGISLVETIAFIVAAVCLRPIHWRIAFVALTLTSLAQVAYYVAIGLLSSSYISMASTWYTTLGMITTGGQPIVAMLVLITAIAERVRGTNRDWIHWTGVLVLASQSIVQFVQMFLAMYV